MNTTTVKTLRDYILEAQEKKIAVGHFNISTIEGIHAVFEGACELDVPVIIGVSEGERDFIGLQQCVDLVKGLREENNFPIFLNADHTHSFEKTILAIEAGFDMVIIDGTKKSLEENIEETKKVVNYVKSKNLKTLVEGEIGYIGEGSEVRDQIPVGVKGSETTPEQALYFIESTGVDLLAPAVGNIHGMTSNGSDPALDIERIKIISEKVGIPLVLHGASGNTDEDIDEAIKAGMAIVHVSTELRVAWKQGIEDELEKMLNEVAPYKLLEESKEKMKEVVIKKLKIFNNIK